MKLPQLTPFTASTIGVILLLSIGLFGQTYLTAKVVNIEPILQQLQQKIQNDIRQAQQTLPPTAQPAYTTIIEQAMKKIDQSAPQWAQKASTTICNLLPKATSAETFVNQIIPQLARSLQIAAQQVIATTVKQNIIIPQGDPAAQQKISDAQLIANTAVKPLSYYGAQQVLINAVQQCPEEQSQKEEQPVSAPDILPETRQAKRVAQAITTAPESTTQPQQQPTEQMPDFSIKTDGDDWIEQWRGIEKSQRVHYTQVQPDKVFVGHVIITNNGDKAATPTLIVKYDNKIIHESRQVEIQPQKWFKSDFNLVNEKLWPGKHQMMFTVQTDKDKNIADNTLVTEITVLGEAPQAKEDARLERVALSQGTAEYSFGPEGELANEKYNTMLRLYVPAGTTTPRFKIFIDGQERQPKLLSYAFIPVPHTAIDLGKIPAGKHTLQIIVDPDNWIFETNEDNNIFEKEFWIKALSAIEQPTQPTPQTPSEPTIDLKVEPAGQKWLSDFDKGTPIDTTQMKTDQRFEGEVIIRNTGNQPATPTFIVKIDGYTIHEQKIAWGIKPQEDYHATFGSGSRKLWPGKHKITLIAQAEKDINPADNTFTSEITIIDPTTGTATPPPTNIDLFFQRVALAQYDSQKKDFTERDSGPQGNILRENLPIELRMYFLADKISKSIPWIEIYLDGASQIRTYGVGSRTVPPPLALGYKEIPALLPGKHNLKLVIDPRNDQLETNEDNNIYELDFWVGERQKDITLLTATMASFNDASAKQKGKNTIDLFIEFTADGRVPLTVPVKIQAGDKVETKTLNTNMQQIPPGGIYWKQNREYFEILVDRNKFPKQIYVSVDYPEDENKANNAVITPVVIVKDRKLYTVE